MEPDAALAVGLEFHDHRARWQPKRALLIRCVEDGGSVGLAEVHHAVGQRKGSCLVFVRPRQPRYISPPWPRKKKENARSSLTALQFIPSDERAHDKRAAHQTAAAAPARVRPRACDPYARGQRGEQGA